MTGAHFRDIVVPYDGSEMSELAVPYAAQFAKRWVGHLTLIRAIPEPAMVTDIPRSILEQVIVQARKELTAAAARAGGEVVVKTMLREGLPVDVILREARGKDMIAMTTNGRSGLSRFVLGSVTEKVIRMSPVPVLVIRPRRGTLKSAGAAAGRMFQDVVVPLDGSDLAREAVAPLAAGLAEDTRLHLLTVVRSGATSKESEAAADWLAGRAATLESRGLVALTRVIHNDSPAEGIGAYAEHNDCGLVVMATHGAGGLREWMLGSVTDQMIRRGPVPVLVVPPHGARKSAKK